MNVRKNVSLIIGTVASIGFAGHLMAIDLPGFPGFPSGSDNGTGSANEFTIFMCKNIGQTSPGTGSSSCESTNSGSSSCASSTTSADNPEVSRWESTKNINPSVFNGTCVEAMKALGNCAVKGAFGNGEIVVECK